MRVKSGSECLDVLWIVLPVGVQSDCPLEAERCGNAESRFQRLPLASAEPSLLPSSTTMTSQQKFNALSVTSRNVPALS